MKAFVKKSALLTMRSLGLFKAGVFLFRRGTLVILCYHGISLRDEHEWAGGLYIPPDLFRARLEFLKAWGANVLPLAEGLARLKNGTLPPRSVVITFDDGFYDFYRFAVPALREFGFPCTLYLTTHYTRYPLPVYNLLYQYLLWKSGDPAFQTQAARDHAVLGFITKCDAEKLDTQARNEAVRALAVSYKIDYESLLAERLFQIMTPEEVSATAAAGIDIQLHTHRHRTPVDHDLFLREIRDNARFITDMTGVAPKHFCYPSGVTDPAFLPWLREAQVASATTCVHGLCRPASDPLLLPRYLDGTGTTTLDFEALLSGWR